MDEIFIDLFYPEKKILYKEYMITINFAEKVFFWVNLNYKKLIYYN